ncbi:MAG: class I SAM-dependent methyltransferase [Desulforhopalus sp.]
MFAELEKINERPKPFQFYTASDLWTDNHTSQQMLSFHLNETIDVSSRNAEFINRSVAWIVSEFNIAKNFKIADFGCGPGLYALPLAKHGASVTGIDFSERSIKYATQVAACEQLNIRYMTQNYLEFQTEERFDLVLMIMCDFCALSPKQRKVLLKKFYTILRPGGSVLLDVYSLAAFSQKKEGATYELNQLNGFWSAEKYYGFVNTFKYEDEKVSLDKYTIIEKSRTRVVYNWLQHFNRGSLMKEFEEIGFEIEALYSDVGGLDFFPDSSEIAVVARKR